MSTQFEGMGKPDEVVDWSVVEVARLRAENEGLRAAVVGWEIVHDVLVSTHNSRVVRLTAERDRARAIAVQLEQELAEAERELEAFSDVIEASI